MMEDMKTLKGLEAGTKMKKKKDGESPKKKKKK
jgi:hypothetical protein